MQGDITKIQTRELTYLRRTMVYVAHTHILRTKNLYKYCEM